MAFVAAFVTYGLIKMKCDFFVLIELQIKLQYSLDISAFTNACKKFLVRHGF